MSLKLLAVSGGIDSMVMLNFLCKRFDGEDFLVATVDHGTRKSSAADAEFVARIARKKCNLPCEILRLSLGEGAPEAEARAARYAAIEELGIRMSGGGKLGRDFEIWTAQHLDDLIESVAINCLRGTGWRGLAVMRRAGVRRPFLDESITAEPLDKKWILRYAAEHNVVWREDPTNQSDNYLRNRLRTGVRGLDFETKQTIYALWQKQCSIAASLDESVVKITTLLKGGLPREWFYEMGDAVADEILRRWLLDSNISTTRPQRADFLRAIREYRAGKLFNLPGDRMIKIGKIITLR